MFPEIENCDNLVVKIAPKYGDLILKVKDEQLISEVLKFDCSFKWI